MDKNRKGPVVAGPVRIKKRCGLPDAGLLHLNKERVVKCFLMIIWILCSRNGFKDFRLLTMNKASRSAKSARLV